MVLTASTQQQSRFSPNSRGKTCITMFCLSSAIEDLHAVTKYDGKVYFWEIAFE